MEIIQLSPGITLRCYRDQRFKQGCISFQMLRPMKKEEAAFNALIPSVLLQGTRNCPNLRAITEYLDTLYGATLRELVRRVGDYQMVGLYCGFMEDRFALPGDKVLEPVLNFLAEVLLDSPTENQGFRQEFVEREKKNLISLIESQKNNKQYYALTQLLKTMCREDSLGIQQFGQVEQVAAIDPVALYRYYRQSLKTSPIAIFYVGSCPASQVAQLLKPLVERLERTPVALAPQTRFHSCPGSHQVETMDVTQGKLCMGFVSPICTGDPQFPAMQVMNTLFGGGMTSKLFQNVREKLSLCYSIGSTYYGRKGVAVVYAGIDFDKEAQTRQEILRQLSACQAGDISEQELNAAKATILSALRATHDSPGSIEGYYATAAFSGLGMTPEEYIQAVEALTKEDVVAAANSLQLHSTYFLKGDQP